MAEPSLINISRTTMLTKSFPTKLTAFAATVLLCCSVLFIHSNARAQCPDNTGPAPDPTIPGGCTWNTDSTYQTIPGTSCNEMVYYCWRDCPGYGQEVWVWNVVPDMTSDCAAVDPLTLIYDANNMAVNAASFNDINIPPCVKGDPETLIEYEPACWLATSTASGGTQFNPCSAEACYCEKQCKVCFEGPGFSITDCTTIGAPTCPCYEEDPVFPGSGHFQLNTCYNVPCQ
jgi:hypothetical protein